MGNKLSSTANVEPCDSNIEDISTTKPDQTHGKALGQDNELGKLLSAIKDAEMSTYVHLMDYFQAGTIEDSTSLEKGELKINKTIRLRPNRESSSTIPSESSKLEDQELALTKLETNRELEPAKPMTTPEQQSQPEAPLLMQPIIPHQTARALPFKNERTPKTSAQPHEPNKPSKDASETSLINSINRRRKPEQERRIQHCPQPVWDRDNEKVEYACEYFKILRGEVVDEIGAKLCHEHKEVILTKKVFEQRRLSVEARKICWFCSGQGHAATGYCAALELDMFLGVVHRERDGRLYSGSRGKTEVKQRPNETMDQAARRMNSSLPQLWPRRIEYFRRQAEQANRRDL